MSSTRSPKGDDIDTKGVFIDFDDDGTVIESDGEGFDEDDEFGPSYAPFYPGAPTSAPEPTQALPEALLGLTWCDQAFSDVLWNHDVRFQARCTPDVKLAVKQILGVPVGEAPEEKISAFGETLTDGSLLDELVKYRFDLALMRGALKNPFALEDTLLYIEKSGVEDETGRLQQALEAYELAHGILRGEQELKDCAQSLVHGGNAAVLKMLEGMDGFESVLALMAPKEHTVLRKAFTSISENPDEINERYLVEFDLNCELVDLDMVWWLTQQDDTSLSKALVLSDEIGELGVSVAQRMSTEAAWWCAMSHDDQVRTLAVHHPELRRVMHWASPPPPPPAKKGRALRKQPKVFNPDEFKVRVSSLLMSGVTPEQVSNLICSGKEQVPLEEGIDLLIVGDSTLVLRWLQGGLGIPVVPGAVEKVLTGTTNDKRLEIAEMIEKNNPELLKDFPWSMELFLVLPGTCEAVTNEQAVWARAYIENAISGAENKAAVLETILNEGGTWSGSIVELVKGIYPEAKGIPVALPPEEPENYDEV